ncbi:efflux RND transporter periplasmic adaptor subunit [Simiduia agarivorans]|uniref:Membrane-fusion protein n=1 Tax=Simiduia agarivorans (strain DSM 21679 / JCM 13881 / BCRC 17597 / SA1) TaxID=1117647 RepID=K4KWU2_SIMAS|nr:efflux RND transporter periplasmic adaptor subunit [Simiduia agarivorans]AFU98412.2 membrane-fusion protein [Simiduia agarivorans SA1 = DSM 21679]
MHKTLKGVMIGGALALGVAALLIGTKMAQFGAMGEAMAQMVMPPTPVNSYTAEQMEWQPRLSAVGSVAPVQGTEVTAEIEGTIREILFTPGAQVQAGTPLVQLDDSLEQASLREAEAAAELAQLALRRAGELARTKSISQLELDNANSNVRQTQARLDYVRALIAKKRISAPFAGQLGIKQVSVGQFINKGQAVVSLQALAQVYVEFSIPQRQLAQVNPGLIVQVVSDAHPDQLFEGKVLAVSPAVDTSTRNLRVQALLDNNDGKLRPGMYVSVSLQLARTEPVLFIPISAVLHSAYGDAVLVIEAGEGDSLITRQAAVRLGLQQGDFVQVLEGLNAGDEIVSTGSFKLAPGMPVVIDNTLAPTFSLDPRPNNS